MRENGFTVQVEDDKNRDAVREQFAVPIQIQSCHTAIVDGYVIEGHVPREEVMRMLKEKPDIVGLSVPGMPIGSPGMEAPDGAVQPYKVISFDKLGRARVFATYPK